MEKGKGVLKPVMARGSPGRVWRLKETSCAENHKEWESRIICWVDWNSRGLRYLRKPNRKHKGHGRDLRHSSVPTTVFPMDRDLTPGAFDKRAIQKTNQYNHKLSSSKSMFPVLESMRLRITPSNRNTSQGYMVHCCCMALRSGTFKSLLFRKRLPDLR